MALKKSVDLKIKSAFVLMLFFFFFFSTQGKKISHLLKSLFPTISTVIIGLRKFYLCYMIEKMENQIRECLLTHFYNTVNSHKLGEVSLGYKLVEAITSC